MHSDGRGARRRAVDAPAVRSHHERWGGGGYPDGLVADQIPIEARIVAAVDASSAMTAAPAPQALSAEA